MQHIRAYASKGLVLLMGMMAVGILFSVGFVQDAYAQSCVGLTCGGQSDCGSGPTPPCFCNTPSSTCYSNSQ
jgi:uncharacterized membrane protein